MNSLAKHLLALSLMAASPALAADLGSNGRLRFAPDALARVDFESASALTGVLQRLTFPSSHFVYSTFSTSELSPHVVADVDALEGGHYLSWSATSGRGFAYQNPALFGSLGSQRVVVSFWGRSDGMEPVLGVTYGNAADFSNQKNWGWARVIATRTGRETSDGWVEYSTNAIDGSVLGRPLHDVIFTGRVPTFSDTGFLLNGVTAAQPNDAFSVDAMEIRPAPGAVATGTCTQQDIDTSCGPASECFFGSCVDSAVVWHPVPPVAMQQEIAERVVTWATRVLGNRSAIPHADASWVAATRALASADATPRSFWGGLSRQVVELRDSHTHLGAPYGGLNTGFFPRPGFHSGTLDACFGPTVNDLQGGQLAYVVWATGSRNPGSLQKGDVVKAIDGLDPQTWVESVLPRYVESMPVDRQSDWAEGAANLAALVGAHARSLTVTRCQGGTCVDLADLDVPSLSLAAVENGQYNIGALRCTPRFTDTVSGAHNDSEGGDNVLYAALDAQTVAIEFDGFTPSSDATWRASVNAALALPHAHVLVDARYGHGGENVLGNFLMGRFRSTGDPVALMLAARGAFDDADAASLFAFDWSQCRIYFSEQCAVEDIYEYQTTSANPPGQSSKVAWLNTQDVSNNDMVPRLLKGRANLRIFAPFNTYGALGSDVLLPQLMQNWGSGTIAASDARYGTTPTAAEHALTFESGTGVVPDQVVTQTLSDVLAGNDTLVTTAKGWLNQ